MQMSATDLGRPGRDQSDAARDSSLSISYFFFFSFPLSLSLSLSVAIL